MNKRGPDDRRLSKALALLDPPPADREKWTKTIHEALDFLEFLDGGDVGPPFERDIAGLTRYIAALHKLKASRAALDPSTHRFLTLGEVSVIEAEISEAGEMLKMSRRPGGQPANLRTRRAVRCAVMALERHGLELTTERKGKWHLLSQIFADTKRDLRHHLSAVLAKPPAVVDDIT
jgi:hypothetical protein